MENLDIIVGTHKEHWVFHLVTVQGRTAISAVTDLIPVEAYGFTSEICTVAVPIAIGTKIFGIIKGFDNVSISHSSLPYPKVLQRARIMAGIEPEPVAEDPLQPLWKAIPTILNALFGTRNPKR